MTIQPAPLPCANPTCPFLNRPITRLSLRLATCAMVSQVAILFFKLLTAAGHTEQHGRPGQWTESVKGGGVQKCLGGELVATQEIAKSREDGMAVALA